MKKRLILTILTALLFGACSNQNEVSQNETEKPVGFVQKEEKAKKERDEQEKIEKEKKSKQRKLSQIKMIKKPLGPCQKLTKRISIRLLKIVRL